MKTQTLGKHSLLATAIMGILSTPLHAQESEQEAETADEAAVEVINVSGTRADLFNAQNIKRFSETVVDAIDASDIGGFPDRSVLEAISRLPGVTMGRFAGANDPDHFGTEGSGVVIRGLTHVRSEFNGRDSFTADSGRGLSFQDVPPELMGSVEVFKNGTADMIEGGIAGTVNLITKKPFDTEGQLIAFSADVTYADFIEESTPTFSALYSNVFENDSGKFGILFNASHSELKAQSDGAMVGKFFNQNSGAGFVPETARLTRKQDDRTRQGFAAVVQWQSPDDTIKATAEYIRSDSELTWTERAIEFDDDNNMALLPVEGTEFEFDDAGYFEKGIITSTAGWRGNDGDRTPGGIFGGNHVLQSRFRDNESTVEDFSVNVKYTPNDSWAFNFDLQLVDGTNKVLDYSIMNGTDITVGLDLTQGEKPLIDFYQPAYNGGDTDRSSNHFTDPSRTYMRSAMDHISDNEGEETAGRFDAKYTFDEGFLTSAQAGVRYAKRDQTTRQSTYNWGNISEAWNGIAWVDTVDPSLNEVVTLDNFSRGDVLTVDGGNSFIFPNIDVVKDYRNAFGALESTIRGGGWSPLSARGNAEGDFIPNEINTTEETNTAAYVKFNFAGELGEVGYSGNFGVRYIRVENETAGFLTFPDNVPNDPNDPTERDNFLPDDQKAFGNAASRPLSGGGTFNKALPSLNVKFDLADDLIFRLSYSESVTLPSLGLLRNAVEIGEEDRMEVVGDDPDGDGPLQPPLISSNIGRYIASTGNPDLKPLEASTYDVTLEWYFAPVGSLTAAIFYKDLENYFINGVRNAQFTNNGSTQTVQIAGPSNGDSGKVQGFEIAYQQFFDSLPAPFDGLGIQANYTYVDEEGSPNSNLSADNPDPGQSGGEFEGLPLEGLSENNANLVLMYEKYGWNGRIAYNWRSEHLLTTRDVITELPIYNESIGFLDASVFYDVTDSLKVGLQGTNLSDEVTRTTMQINQQGDRRTRGTFVSDRRISLVVRGVF